MSNGYNPHQKWKLGFRNLNAAPGNPNGGNLTPANSKVVGPDETLDSDGNLRGSLRRSLGTTVDLPRNLYAPPGSQSLELTTSFPLGAGLTATVTPFRGPQGTMVQILGYAFTTTGPGVTFFNPSVNGFRVFPFHGDPQSNFDLNTSTGPDLTVPVPAQLSLKPGDLFAWLITNTDVVAHTVAVRTTGYVISTIRFEDTRFGG